MEGTTSKREEYSIVLSMQSQDQPGNCQGSQNNTCILTLEAIYSESIDSFGS